VTHSEGQILWALRQVEAGKWVAEFAARWGTARRRTTCGWGSIPGWDVRELRHLPKENGRLKRPKSRQLALRDHLV